MKEYELSGREQEQDILFGVINRFIGYFTRRVVSATSNDTSCEYPFVAMDTRQAYEQIRLARSFLVKSGKDMVQVSFIDIGCGIGNILLLAEMMEFSVYGIEKDKASLSIARSLVGDGCVSQEDIWEFNQLGAYDVVYYFRPFCTEEMQVKFEHLIEEQLKQGGILIANRKMDASIDTDPRFCRLDPVWPVWLKKKTVHFSDK
ncbi:MAG: SAM-dependent methyltransferase [Desulfobulbus propionicus]|nr:MAG: SAM-dependent methyltransferase [Desulfobulbus propionicus]